MGSFRQPGGTLRIFSIQGLGCRISHLAFGTQDVKHMLSDWGLIGT